MKKFFVLALSLALAVSAVTACAAESRTDAEVRALAREIVAKARDAAFYPAAFDKEGFSNFYSTFHVVARKLRGDPPMVAADYDQVMLLKERLAGLKQIVADPTSTVWKIWGDTMPVEDMTGADWEHSYDNEGFEPFLNPFLLKDQSIVRGNIVIIAGGSTTHRSNHVEGYPVAEFFNSKGYNAFVLQRRVHPYVDRDDELDLARAIRYIRFNAEKLGIGQTDRMITAGFSAGGMCIVSALATQYGTITPDTYYSNYTCDAIDAVNADYDVALLIYGAMPDIDISANPNLPDMFMVAGQDDADFWNRTANMALKMRDAGVQVEAFMPTKTPHGFGLGFGVPEYTDTFTAASAWPELAATFIEIQLGYIPGTIDLTK